MSNHPSSSTATAADREEHHLASGPEPAAPRLAAQDVVLGYDDHVVLDGLEVVIPPGSFTVIIGPNACGKSTLLRALARLLRPTAGTVLLDGADSRSQPSRAVARTVGLLPQSTTAPEAITVLDLVSRGRYPHQGLLRQWSGDDERAVCAALEATTTKDLAHRSVDELSGGQRQRVWIAMVLAQETPLMLLDEPTTFLDIAHQIELLELLTRLHLDGRTLVAVLHDINQAARYATHLIAVRDGAIAAQGTPSEVVTAELVESVFEVRCRVLEDPETRTPMIVPLARNAVTHAP